MQGRCNDGNKVSHSHSFKYAVFNRDSAMQVNEALKETRELLQEVSGDWETEGGYSGEGGSTIDHEFFFFFQ